ncbi:MAG: hypothetical protein KIT72_03805 [Polyangiaceae bacterium]|nr:hypothetical protein [Polyangiaceae bacterium]MCW5789527.1 hypothetical protein [Polyangiaceae bacterium]
MTVRCRETAGVLFQHRCEEPPSAECTICRRPICQRHQRWDQHSVTCVSCLRGVFKDPYKRHSYAHLNDDPYFFWYFHSRSPDPYGSDDYALFDYRGSSLDGPTDDNWAGS